MKTLKIKNLGLSLLLLLATPTVLSSCTSKNVYGGYYSSLTSWSNGEDLKNKLHEIISGGSYRALPYDVPNYESNIDADHTLYDYEKLDILYTGDDVLASETNTSWQREHCWPASLMCGETTDNAVKKLGRATDFHNLYACSPSGNQAHKNRYYEDISDDMTTKNKMNQDHSEGYKTTEFSFEPGNNDKGKVARAMFYMATMYCKDDTTTNESFTLRGLTIGDRRISYAAGSSCEFAVGGLTSLLKWNSYEVTYAEYQHNESVYSHVYSKVGYAQGNRNPYVDFPELVDYVFGSKKNQAGKLQNLTPSVRALEKLKSTKTLDKVVIKSAKRSYKYGETLKSSDYKVLLKKSGMNYKEFSKATSDYDDHVFKQSDGANVTVTITAKRQSIKYNVSLDPSGDCNQTFPFNKDGLSNTIIGQDQSVTKNNIAMKVNWVATSGFTIQNQSSGGCKMGSSTKALTKLTITSVDSYQIDRIYIQCRTGNADSSYTLNIKVGNDAVFSDVNVPYDKTNCVNLGGLLSEPKTGQISFVFEGSNSLIVSTIAFKTVDSNE